MNLLFDAVKKYYGPYMALDIPSLNISDGIWWVQGENGSGKTTLLKMIAGLHTFEGSILLDDFSIKKHRQQFVMRVNYAEAEPLYPQFLTAQDLVELYCKTKKSNKDEALEMLGALHILDVYKKPLGSYSSGMLKKLSLALAFIGHPQLILLDEPLITIDVAAIEIICTLVKSAYANRISFIITSHQKLHKNQMQFTGTLLANNQTITLVP